MKTKRLDFSYKPLETLKSIEVIGSITNRQAYDSTTGEYAPDYTLAGSNLILQPHAGIIDRNGAGAMEVTPSLGSGTWYWTEIETVNGVTREKTIVNSDVESDSQTGTRNYGLTTSGANNCRLAVKRNIPVGSSITLVFHAQYLYAKTGDVYRFKDSIRVTCENETGVPTMSIDCPTPILWNPLRHPQTKTVRALLKICNTEVGVARRTFYWEKKRSDGSYSVLGSDAQDDFGYTITDNGATYTQDMNYIGEKQDMRLRVKYGDLSTAAIDDSITVYFTLVRRVTDFDYDYADVPDNIEPGVKTVYPRVVVTDGEGVVPNALRHLRATWYTGAGTASGEPTMAVENHGDTPAIPTSKINANGMVLGIEVKDMGNYKRMRQVINGQECLLRQVIGGVEKIIVCKTNK